MRSSSLHAGQDHESPAVTIITPHFNTPRPLLQACADSILLQAGCTFEWIIADDGSAPQALERLTDLASRDSRIRIVAGPHEGASAARNRALDLARGQYVTFVDADDRLVPGALAALLKHARATGADVLYSYLELDYGNCTVPPRFADPGKLEVIGPEGMDGLRTLILAGEPPASLSRLAGLQNAAVAGKLYRREVLASLDFEAGMTYGEDALFNVMAAQRAHAAAVWQHTTYVYAVHDDASTRKPDKLEFARLRDHRYFNERGLADRWNPSDIGLRFAKSLHGALIVGSRHRSVRSLYREVRALYREPVSRCLANIDVGRYAISAQKRLLFLAMKHRSATLTTLLAYLLGAKRELEQRRARRVR